MKMIILVLGLLSTSAFSKDAGGGREASSWALMVGQGTLNDGGKKSEGFTPSGTTFKGIWGHRSKYFESGLMVRYGKLTDEFKFENTKGKIVHNNIALGGQAGFWAFSWLKAHVGYAYNGITESVEGDYTVQQELDIRDQYELNGKPTYGIYFGGDLILAQSKDFQFFLNYDYYHLNKLKAHYWEGMVGARIYTGPSKVGKGNFFVKLFQELLMPSEK